MSEIHRKADITSFQYGEFATPFAAKGQEYDLPIGSLRQKAYRYRSLTFVFLGVSVLLAMYFLRLANQPGNHVLAAQISKKGFVSKVVMLQQNYTVSPKIVKAFIKRYMHVWFSGKVDEDTLKQNNYFMKSFASPAVAKRFKQFMDTHALTNWSKPVMLSQFKILDGNTINAQFKVPHADETGQIIGYNTFNGEFKLRLGTDQSAKQVKENPFGFYISTVKLAPNGKDHD